MEEMVLYSTFEEIETVLGENSTDAKMMEFIEPLPDVEEKISLIARASKVGGNLSFILGTPGTGKSTFIRSLSWKRHIGISGFFQIDANDYTENIDGIFREIQSYKKLAIEKKDLGPTCIVIDYLEYLDEYDEKEIKAFFRKLNGLLRKTPMLILWPVTNYEDVETMLDYAQQVSGTLFLKDNEIINFSGPKKNKFKDITIRTISVLNDGKDITEFGMTYDDFTEIDEIVEKLPIKERTIREYINISIEKWKKNSKYQDDVRASIPKTTEVWFLFCYKEAERVVSQFVKKSDRIEDSWTVIHEKLNEYARSGQKSADWDAKRLQMALYGSIKTRILFLPTNTLISILYAYTDNKDLMDLLEKAGAPKDWKRKYQTKKTFKRTAPYKQLMGEIMHAGLRRGGPALVALEKGSDVFEHIVKWISSGGSGSDKVLNKCVREVLRETTEYQVDYDQYHPWIKNVIPDIFVDMPHKQVCMEFHYTNKDEPHIIANYVLKKLNTYMNELERLTTT